MHLDVAFSTLFDLLTTSRLLFLMAIAVPMGVFFGSTPGLGGKLGLVLLIPFVYNMDQLTGAVFLCAMHAVVHTGGSIPSILIGVPGDGPAAATALDGYAMTRKGEAGRALGASFGASTVGGLLGAMFLGLSLPILEPIILNFSPAEFFLLAILGITFIATLSGDSFVKGMIVGLFGLMCAFIGLDPSTGSPRFTFGQIWLWDGLSVIVAETGSCAKEAGSLLPTLFFGVPGSSGMAIMLGAFLMLGIQPGPTMLTEHVNIVWSLIWALVIANILCVIMLTAVGPWIGRLGSMKASFLIPYVLVFALLGCYLYGGIWQNLILVMVMGSLG